MRPALQNESLCPDRPGISGALGGLPPNEKRGLTSFEIEPSNGYRSIVRRMFPNARTIADKFHALRLLSPALMKLRKQINGNKLELKQRRLLLRNRKDLKYFEKLELDKFLEKYPELEELYFFKERLRTFYKCRNHRQARRNLEVFISDLERSR